MRNTGLHRGADEISVIRKGILAPTAASIASLCADIGGLRASEASCWKRRSVSHDPAELREIIAEQLALEEKLSVLLAELERKLTLKRVFEMLIGHRAGDVQKEYMDPDLRMTLSHGEGLMLKEIEELVLA